MEIIPIVLVAAAVFGVCYLVDKAFTKKFRSQAQHMSGMAVRANKRYGVFGVVLTILGILAICVGITDGPVLIDCIIDCDERVLPMIPPGGTVNDLVIK